MRMKALGVVLAALAAAICVVAAPAAWARTVWLCKPGQSPDPCTPGLSTTVYSPSLQKRGVEHPKQVAQPAIDCFYVYPTVSAQQTGNSNLHVDPGERLVAGIQAARYSQLCRVFAPMYRQVTLAGLGLGSHPTTAPNPGLALADLRAAFGLYLKQYNRGRGFVLIGHSQGSFMLRQLIAKDIDPKPTVRKLLLSAILLGGNVLVKAGQAIGGDFRHIRACHSDTQLQCVIAFSSFDEPVPSGTLFGRPLPILGTSAAPGQVVLCTNPAALGGGSGRLDPIFPGGEIGLLGSPKAVPQTVWAAVPGAYRAFCSSANDAHVLQITPLDGAPKPPETLGPAWGLHLLDANIALGNLISIIRSETSAFRRSARPRAL
jgi:hypothetical protein